jgi:hypothetical protein
MINNQDPHWFPMRVAYGNTRRLLALSQLLEERHRIHYIPMEYVTKGEKVELVPAVSNLLFIQTNLEDLLNLKKTAEFKDFRFIMRPIPDNRDRQQEVVWVRDREMEDFIRVTTERNEKVLYLNNLDFALRPGARVEVKDGPFAGVQGIVKSIQKHLCVVLPVGGVVAVAILNIPKKSLIYLPQEDKTIKIQ